MDFVYVASIIVVLMFLSIAVFQVLLSLGFPLGEFALGGYYKVLPIKLRVISAVNAIVLLFMAFVFLLHSNILTGFSFLSTTGFVWIITIFLALNTVANLASQSKKERLVMTPLSCITFILCLIVALS